jgi:hypothetical protein
MEENEIFEKFTSQYKSLRDIINESLKRTIHEPTDPLFNENINFFVKAYLINICTYLEAYLQELANLRLEKIKKTLETTIVPHNIIMWCTKKDFKDHMKFDTFSIDKTSKDISDNLSGNPYKTINTFKLLGIDLLASDEFKTHKEVVGSIVDKRNNIIHHNDDASDISLSDLDGYISTFEIYSRAILSQILITN